MRRLAVTEAFGRWRRARLARATDRLADRRRAAESLEAWRRRFNPRRHLRGWEDKPPPPTGLSF